MERRGTYIKATAAAKVMAIAAAVALIFMSWGCERERGKEGALSTCEAYTVYPDSFVSTAMVFAAHGDTMTIRTGAGEIPARVKGSNSSGMAMEGSDGLIAYLFNCETRKLRGSYDGLTAYEIYVSEALLDVQHASEIVDRRIVGGELAENSVEGYRWPVAMSDATWGIAAAAVSAMEGDGEKRERRARILKRLVDRDISYVYDRREGLFCGVPAEMGSRELPSRANAGDMAVMMTLAGNVDRYAAMRCVDEVMPGSYNAEEVAALAGRIRNRFWMPDKGMLSQALYQRPYPLAVQATDNIAQAMAIVTGVASGEMARRIVAKTPMAEGRVPVSYPNQGMEGDSRRVALTSAMWAIASAEVGNGDAWAHSYGSLVARGVADNYALRLLQGVTLRTIFGVKPESEGLRFAPYVHDKLGDYHRVSGLRYRNCELAVTVRGRGSEVSTFTIDGRVKEQAMVPADMSGAHEVEIVLAGGEAADEKGTSAKAKTKIAESTINISEIPQMAPTTQVMEERGGGYVINRGDGGRYRVYVNGAVEGVTEQGTYEPKAERGVTAYSFEPVGKIGYASRVMLRIAARDSMSIACKEVATTGGRVLAKKDLAAKYVESTRYKNSRLTFEYESEGGGEYYVRLRYLDGLGIVNRNRQYALRLLRVNGEQAGLMVLPQRGPEMWRADEDWATMRGTTEPIVVRLNGGRNEIVVEYYAPEMMPDFDHDGNTVIPVALELIKIE